MANEGWMSDIHEADAIIISTHSQGSIVSTHLLDRLIHDNHITTTRNHDSTMSFATGAETYGMPETITRKSKIQRVCCMALCGIHLGPLKYLSSLVQPYIQVSWPSVLDYPAMEFTCILVFRVGCCTGIVRVSGMLL